MSRPVRPVVPRSRRLLLAGSVAVLATGALAAPAGATTWGIADQKPSTFTTPAFQQLQGAGMRTARYTMRFDALRFQGDGGARGFYAAQADAWLTAARAAGVRPLVTFWVTASGSSSLKRTIPVATYRRELKRFRQRYPFVKDFSLFNEPNLTGPFKTKPEALGRLYKAVKADLRSCSGCILLGGDLHLENGARTAAYAARVARGAGGRIPVWGINNYHDVNDRTSTQTDRFLRSPAARRSKVWITESGGVYSRKASSERSSPFLAQRKRATSDAARETYQFNATKFLGTIARRHRSQIQRGYVYQLQSEPNPSWVPGSRNGSWDSGLLDPRGQQRRSFGYVLNTLL